MVSAQVRDRGDAIYRQLALQIFFHVIEHPKQSASNPGLLSRPAQKSVKRRDL